MDLKQIAQTTAGFTGADLENLLNEAAIIAAKDQRMYICQNDIKNVHTVRCCDNDDALIDTKTVHLYQQLVQCLKMWD